MTALFVLLGWAANVFVALFLLRFIFQAVRADFYNPISQAIVKFTNPLVMPLRKIVPGFRGWDLASLVAALLVHLAFALVIHFLFNSGGPNPAAFLVRGIFSLIDLIFGLYIMMIFISIILSWLQPDPRNPLISLLWSVTEPVLRPFRKLLPPMGGLDLSPMIALLGLVLLRVLINADIAPMLLSRI